MDISFLFYVFCVVVVQILVGFFIGNWVYGVIVGCMFFIVCEYIQVEYCWIEMFGYGK